MSTVTGFFAGFALFFGYVMGAGFVILGALKPLFPDNIGVWVNDQAISNGLDIGTRIGAGPGVRAGEHLAGGYWVIPIFLVVGFFLLVVTHRGARRFLGWWRRHRPSFTVS
jgi:amino acid transporter